MSSIQPTGSSVASQLQQRIGSWGSRGGNPSERLTSDLSKFFSKEQVASDVQQTIKSEFRDALSALSSSGSQVGPTQIKEALTKVLTSHGLDGESFVSGLGTPPTGNAAAQQGGQASGKRPPGGGPPPPPPSTSETSSSSETDYLQQLLELLSEDASTSTGTSATQTSQQVLPGSFINRSGGNLDAQA